MHDHHGNCEQEAQALVSMYCEHVGPPDADGLCPKCRNGALTEDLTRALAEKDAKLAEAQLIMGRQFQQNQADLAAMRGALARIKQEAGADLAGDAVSVADDALRMLDRIEVWAADGLTASRGAAAMRPGAD